MIRRIELLNFMSHAWTVIEPADGLTVLVGPNNCGKSAVVAVVSLLGVSAGAYGVIRERVTYSSYGVPQGLSPGDLDNDSDCDAADETLWTTLSGGSYDVRADLDLDGDMDITDEGLLTGAANQGFGFGRGVLTRDNGLSDAMGNRKGYAGYEHDGVFNTMCHVRNRVLLTDLGRWSRRDPLGYVDGMGLYEYVGSKPSQFTDMYGLQQGPPAQVQRQSRGNRPNDQPVVPELPGGGGPSRPCSGPDCVTTGTCSQFKGTADCGGLVCHKTIIGCTKDEEDELAESIADTCARDEFESSEGGCSSGETCQWDRGSINIPITSGHTEGSWSPPGNSNCRITYICTWDRTLEWRFGTCVRR